MAFQFDQLTSVLWAQLWQVTIVAALAAVFVRLFCRHRPHLAYLMWMLVVLKCLTPPIVGSPTSPFSWLQATREVSIENDVVFVLDSDDDSTSSNELPIVETTAATTLPTTVAEENVAVVGPASPATPARESTRATQSINLVACLLYVWLAGVGIVAMIAVVRTWKCCGALRKSVRQEAKVRASVDAVAQELGIRSQVRVIVTRESFGPAVFGLLRSTIILPSSVVERSSDHQLRTIIGHELMHVRRRDTWMGLVQLCTQVLWWFHPFVWWANRQATIERERCCDMELLARLKCDPAVYAQSLLDVLKQKQTLHGLFALPGMKPMEITARRLADILEGKPKVKRTPWWNWVLAAIACAVLLPGGGMVLSVGDAAEETEVATSTKLAQPASGEWPQAGGTSHRNNVNLNAAPTSFDIKIGKNVLWKKGGVGAEMTWCWSWLNGNASPVVASGKVLVGANNAGGLVTRLPSENDRAVLACFDQRTGEFLWQHSNKRLETGRMNDWPLSAIASAPYVDGDRLWYVNNRAEVVCLDLEGFRDGDNDGPFKGEEVEALDEADVVWKFDMIEQFGAFPHNRSTCSITAAGDLLLIVVPNGVDASHVRLPSPKAPSFIALHKETGKVVWQDDSASANILHGQFGSAVYGVIDGVPQAIFPGGDGWLYSFDVRKMSKGKTKLLWKFDCNPKRSKWILGGRGTRNNLIAAPVIHDGLVYAIVGQDAEHGEGNGHLWCIDPTRRGDISAKLVVQKDDTSVVVSPRRSKAIGGYEHVAVVPNPNEGVVWHFDKFDVDGDGKIDIEESLHRSVGSVVVKDGLLIATDMSGFVRCFDAKLGVRHWMHDPLAAITATPLIAGRHVYVPDEDGKITILALSKTKTVVNEVELDSSISTTMIAVDGTLYIQANDGLFAIRDDAPRPEKKRVPKGKPTRRTSSNWPGFRGGGGNDGVARDSGPSKLKLKWKVKAGKSEIEATPIVADDAVYIGDVGGTLYAFDRETGKLRWKTETHSGFIASPAFVNSLICVGDEAGAFNAFDAKTGKLKWSIETGGAILAGANVSGTRALFANQSGEVYCVETKVGKVLWKVELGDQVRSTPTIVGERVLVSGCDAKLHILDLKTGKHEGKKELGSQTMSTPAADESSAILGTEDGVIAIDLSDDGETLWTFEAPKGSRNFRSSPAVTTSTMFIGSSNGNVYALNRSDGKVLWRTSTKGGIDASPVVVGKIVLTGSKDGRIYAMSTGTGEVQWSYEAGDDFRSSIAVGNGVLATASVKGVVYCFGE